jgi:hypothetical protein
VKAKPKKPAAKRAPIANARADYGKPIDGWFAKQPPPLRAIVEELRGLIEKAAPDAESSIKWGNPFFTLGGGMFTAMSAHKAHVNLILAGPPTAFPDPDGRLTGSGKLGRHLKLTHLDELPRAAVRGWLRTAAELARKVK